MILLNIWGTPGAGKSTAAADLYAFLKKNGIQAELAGESARNFIYSQGTAALYDNQFYVSAIQFEMVYRLYRCGVEVAIADCPVLQGSLYSKHLPYHEELKALMRKAEAVLNPYNILIRRAHKYDGRNRLQTEAEADGLLQVIREELLPSGRFFLEVDSNEDGLVMLRKTALALVSLWKDQTSQTPKP